MQYVSFKDLDKVQQRLLNAAEEAMKNAYCPYSKFRVGAAILTIDHTIITGSNVENASYGATICAERAAILRANAMEKRFYEKIAIIAKGEDFDTKKPVSPCGDCRQMLYESSQIADKDLEIIMSTTNKESIIISSIEELLPFAFGPKDLGVDISKYQE